MTDFRTSETAKNLMRAFAGESQARNRYTFAAGLAREQKLPSVEAIFLFRQDLETAVSDYCRQCLDTDPFTYGIYQLLSAGDFAVVVRSRQAKTAFSVSTLIRRRSVCVKENGLGLVLYKTYTILTIDGCIIDVFPDAEAAKGQFVLRGCYSNLYWSKKDEIKEIIIIQRKVFKKVWKLGS